MAPAMPCKRQPSIVKTSAKSKTGNENEFKPMYDCVVESHKSTRHRAESLQSKNHEDDIAGEGFTSVTHYNLVHKFIPMPQAMKIPDAKAAVDKEWKKLETIPAWDLEKSRARREVILEAQRDKKKVHFATLMGQKSPQKMRSWNPNCRSNEGLSRGLGGTLSRTTLEPTQFSLNKARLRPR